MDEQRYEPGDIVEGYMLGKDYLWHKIGPLQPPEVLSSVSEGTLSLNNNVNIPNCIGLNVYQAAQIAFQNNLTPKFYDNTTLGKYLNNQPPQGYIVTDQVVENNNIKFYGQYLTNQQEVYAEDQTNIKPWYDRSSDRETDSGSNNREPITFREIFNDREPITLKKIIFVIIGIIIMFPLIDSCQPNSPQDEAGTSKQPSSITSPTPKPPAAKPKPKASPTALSEEEDAQEIALLLWWESKDLDTQIGLCTAYNEEPNMAWEGFNSVGEVDFTQAIFDKFFGTMCQ